MPFKDSGTYPISNKDLVSFTFDDPDYDLDKPVSQSSKCDRTCHGIRRGVDTPTIRPGVPGEK